MAIGNIKAPASLFICPSYRYVDSINKHWQPDATLKEISELFSFTSDWDAFVDADGSEEALRILLIEDDQVLGAAIRDHIASNDHSVDWMRRIDDARLALSTVEYELVLLDLGLPDDDGLALLRELRAARNPVPVIIATAQDQIAVRIAGLNAGADDYLVKPFDLSEMSARIAAVTRRYTGNPNPALDVGPVSIDLALKRVTVAGEDAALTAREWAVLERLVRHRGAVVTKSEIEDSLYEFGAEIDSNAVEVYVSRLRKKLGREFVSTIRGLGYKAGS